MDVYIDVYSNVVCPKFLLRQETLKQHTINGWTLRHKNPCSYCDVVINKEEEYENAARTVAFNVIYISLFEDKKILSF